MNALARLTHYMDYKKAKEKKTHVNKFIFHNITSSKNVNQINFFTFLCKTIFFKIHLSDGLM